MLNKNLEGLYFDRKLSFSHYKLFPKRSRWNRSRNFTILSCSRCLKILPNSTRPGSSSNFGKISKHHSYYYSRIVLAISWLPIQIFPLTSIHCTHSTQTSIKCSFSPSPLARRRYSSKCFITSICLERIDCLKIMEINVTGAQTHKNLTSNEFLSLQI